MVGLLELHVHTSPTQAVRLVKDQPRRLSWLGLDNIAALGIDFLNVAPLRVAAVDDGRAVFAHDRR